MQNIRLPFQDWFTQFSRIIPVYWNYFRFDSIYLNYTNINQVVDRRSIYSNFLNIMHDLQWNFLSGDSEFYHRGHNQNNFGFERKEKWQKKHWIMNKILVSVRRFNFMTYTPVYNNYIKVECYKWTSINRYRCNFNAEIWWSFYENLHNASRKVRRWTSSLKR